MLEVARLVDAEARDRALVSGSLPPQGRDLDLVVRPSEEEAFGELLRREGFLRNGGEWVRFRGCVAEAVDLIPVSDWQLPEDETAALFSDAVPLEGFDRLARPAPHHLLLMLALRLVRGDGLLDDKRRARVQAAADEQGDVWEKARRHAGRWGLERGLEGLFAAFAAGTAMPVRRRVEALAERFTAVGMCGRRARAQAWRHVLRPPPGRGGFLVSFSGLDGAGKSSQAEALRDALERLGYDARLEWTRLEWTTLWETGSALGRIAWPVKTALHAAERIRGAEAPAAQAEQSEWYTDVVETPATRLRARSPLINQAWVTVVALAHARAQRRATAPHIRAGRAVVCDRYTLDAAAVLRFRYRGGGRLDRQIRLMERLSPRPLRAYHVDVPGRVAYARKPEQYTAAELEEQARLYREEGDRLGVRRVDGQRTREELCGEIAADVWRTLRGLPPA
ncbi:MAG: dTMP kinase [Gaiellaceae bacterium]